MRKKIIFLIALLFIISGCKGRADDTLARAVITKTGKNKPEYYAIYDKGKKKKTASFKEDDIDFYYADDRDFTISIKDGRTVNELKQTTFKNQRGQAVKADKTMIAIMRQAEKIDQAIYQLLIIKDDERYFVFIKQNVNNVYACQLYEYENKLHQLCTWDEEVDLIGMAV